MEIFYKALGEIVRNLRKSNQYSTIDVAEKLGISPRTYRNLESGQRMFTVTQLEGLGEIFDMNWISLIDEAFKVADFKGVSRENAINITSMLSTLYKKSEADKKARDEKVYECIIDLIRLTERIYTPNKYLSNDDIYDLGDLIIGLVNTRVKQIIDKKKYRTT